MVISFLFDADLFQREFSPEEKETKEPVTLGFGSRKTDEQTNSRDKHMDNSKMKTILIQ